MNLRRRPIIQAMSKGERALETALLLAVVLFAAILRLWDLSEIPHGFHGDEAVSGLEAERIWRENGIGPYTGAALGEPTGPLYVVALAIRIFGETIFAVRFVSVLAGVLTIVVLYFFARRFFDWKMALLAAFLLTISNWHLHFSRIGFPVAAWPLFVLLGVWFLLEAIERRHLLRWIFAGAVLGSGLYIYNAHVLFVAIAGLFAAWCLWRDKKITGRTRAFYFFAFAITLLCVAVPMLLYARRPESYFTAHFELYSLFRRAEWLQTSYGMRSGVLIGRYLDFWERLCWHPVVDSADGTGIVPQMSLAVVLLAWGGAFALWKTRRDNVLILLVALLILLPCGAVITIDGTMRRTLALAPVLALFAACGVREISRMIQGWKPSLRVPWHFALMCFLLLLGGKTLFDYYEYFPRTEQQSWAFVTGITEASQWVKKLPREAHIYFMSERWSQEYQTRQFLAPEIWIEDRSKEHGIFSLDEDDRDTDSVWLLLDKYQIMLPRIRALHPGGEVIEGPPLPGTRENCFVAYRLRRRRP